MLRDSRLKFLINHRLQGFDRAPLQTDTQDFRQAAVALVIVDEGFGAGVGGLPTPLGWSAKASLLLTRRPTTMRRHAGQWALPGGRLDDGETHVEAALRELHEEVGLDLPASAVLGRLDDFATRSGFVMAPIVVWGGAARRLIPEPCEVASIHRIPLQELMRKDAPILRPSDAPPEETTGAPMLRMPIGNDYIAAPTAALLYQFRELCLAGRKTRVAHYEQPYFAWR